MNHYEERLQKIAVERYIRESGLNLPSAPPSYSAQSPPPTSSPPQGPAAQIAISSDAQVPATQNGSLSNSQVPTAQNGSLSSSQVPTAQNGSLSNLLSFSTLDVFTLKQFKGNQLAVVHVPSNLSDSDALTQERKQKIAREFNFSETVFIHEPVPGSQAHKIDIFTVKEELPFAGHPVIGTLNYMAQRVDPPLRDVTLLCKAGPIVGLYHQNENVSQAEIPQNLRIHNELVPSRFILSSQPDALQNILALDFFPVVSIVKGLSFVLINVPSVLPYLEMLEPTSFTFDASKIVFDEGWENSFLGAYFFAKTSHPQQATTSIRARMLERSVGEDAATGSAASALACFLALKDGTPGKTHRYNIQQGIEMGRPSDIGVSVELNSSGKSVSSLILAGSAVLVTQGTMTMPKT